VIRPAWQPVAAAVLVILLMGGAVIGIAPPARRAVAGWLGLRGVKIRILPSLHPTAPPLGTELELGFPATLQRARELATYRVLLPTDPGLGQPDAVFESPSLPGGRVTLVYTERPGIPASSFTGAALLFMEFQAKVDREFLEFKGVGPGTSLRAIRVGGQPGFWITGPPHEVGFRSPSGRQIFDAVRLAGNVLIWERGDLVLRIEGEIDLARALEIAGSVR
jgi:hypothetical protein